MHGTGHSDAHATLAFALADAQRLQLVPIKAAILVKVLKPQTRAIAPLDVDRARTFVEVAGRRTVALPRVYVDALRIYRKRQLELRLMAAQIGSRRARVYDSGEWSLSWDGWGEGGFGTLHIRRQSGH